VELCTRARVCIRLYICEHLIADCIKSGGPYTGIVRQSWTYGEQKHIGHCQIHRLFSNFSVIVSLAIA